MLQLLQFLSIFLSGIIAGGFVEGLLGQIPAKKKLSSEVVATVNKETSKAITRYAAPLSIFLLIDGLLLFIFIASYSIQQLTFTIIGSIGVFLTIGVTIFGNLPINKIYQQTPKGQVPDNFSILQNRWNMFHTIRTITAILAFCCYLLNLFIK